MGGARTGRRMPVSEIASAFSAYADSRAFFAAARRASLSLPGLRAAVAAGEVDTGGGGGRGQRRVAFPDPTASRAIFLAEVEPGLIAREAERLRRAEDLVSCASSVIAAVAAAFGAKYADALEARFVDDLTWEDAARRCGCSRRAVIDRSDIALDLIDMHGVRWVLSYLPQIGG